MKSKKIVVIGAGHNGLVAAAYLAKAGHEVTVLEKRGVAGGASSTDTTTFPGFKISTASYVNSLFLPEIVRDLELEKYGYKVIPRNPSSFTPLSKERDALFLGPDPEFNRREISRFSEKDAIAYARYEVELGELAEWVAKLMTMTPPNLPPRNMRDVRNVWKFLRHVARLSFAQLYRLTKLLTTEPVEYLNQWFESDILKATLLTDALIGATKLSGYVLLHHVMGEAGGARGVWGYMKGGMGGIATSLVAASKAHGVKVILNAHVTRISINSESDVSGVVAWVKDASSYAARQFIPADIVVSAIGPNATFDTLLDSMAIAKGVAAKLAKYDVRSATMKINLTLSGLPDFRAVPGVLPGPQHCGTIHIAPTVAYVKEALRDFERGKCSTRPILELTIPSVLDDTLAPPGFHVMNIFLQFVPFKHPKGKWKNEKMEYFQSTVLPLLREYIANIDAIICGLQILSPEDIESEFGMAGGNIFHGAMSFGQLFSFRPIRGMADYRTPVKGLYLGGAGGHPGGGITGACGYNAAREILSDIGT